MLNPIKSVTVLVCLFGMAGLSAGVCHAQALQWKFAAGDSFTIIVEQSSTVKTEVDRRTVDQNNTMTLDIEWSVEDLETSDETTVAKIRQMITRVQTEMTMPGEKGPKTIVYDSDAESASGDRDVKRIAASFSKIINQPVFVFVSTQGEITDVQVPDETMEQLRQMPGSMQGRQMFELESIKEMFANAGMQLPDEGAESWEVTRDFSIGTPQQYSQTSTYTLEPAEDEKDHREISFTATITPITAPENNAINEAGKKGDTIEFEKLEIVDQKAGGTILFDTASGNCQESNSTTMFQTRSQYRDMEITVTVNSQAKMTMTRK